MGPLTNRVDIRMYLYGLAIEPNNFAFEVKVMLGLESTHLESWDTRMDGRTDRKSQVLKLLPA